MLQLKKIALTKKEDDMNRWLSKVQDKWNLRLQGNEVVRQFRARHDEHAGWSVKAKDYDRESISFPVKPSERVLGYLRKRLEFDSALRFNNVKWENGRLIAWRTGPTA